MKLRLPSAASHATVASILSPHHIKTHFQENIFFDGFNKELTSQQAVLRLRFYDGDARCVASLKAKSIIKDGVSRVEEDEEDLDPWFGRACVTDPMRILEAQDSIRVLRRAREEFGIGDGGFVCIGGFRNVRNVYEWKGVKIELDETVFEFGTCYEIECESSEPEKVKKLIEDLLNRNGVPFSYSLESKFAIFMSGRLP